MNDNSSCSLPSIDVVHEAAARFLCVENKADVGGLIIGQTTQTMFWFKGRGVN